MKKKNPYIFMILCMLIASFICTFLSYYSTGVVERSQAKRIIDDRLDMMSEKIE